MDDLKDERIFETERGSTRSHSLETWLLACRKTDYEMNGNSIGGGKKSDNLHAGRNYIYLKRLL
jgi:hypothetical protein